MHRGEISQLLGAYSSEYHPHIESFEVLLKVGLGRLRSRANGHGDVLVVVAAGTRLEQVRARLVVRRNKHTDTVRPPHVTLGGPLMHVREVQDQTPRLHVGTVHVPSVWVV